MALLTAINAKYIHTNLAVRYLHRLCCLPFLEFSINDRAEVIAAELFRTGEKIFLFSCYLWNIRMVLDLCDRLKKADSTIVTVLGGPEVSFGAEELLAREKNVDFILCGEGEASLPKFLKALRSGDFASVPNLVWRNTNGISVNPCAEEIAMDDLPFPYDEGELAALSGRLIYYETSRGCPFQCGFCLSSATRGVRFMSLERVKREMLVFIRAGVPLVKLVDRTFNADNRRAAEIVRFIKQHSQKTCFHFEVKAETMSEELLQELETAEKGLFQLEIGIQSTNEATLARIRRGADFGKITRVVQRLSANQNIHLHLDLIAGLPGETLEQFIRSFDDVFALRPHDLQLGFLKKLKGAQLDTAGSEFTAAPPYEVIHSDAMTFSELLLLKDVEDVLEKYYNSGAFSNTMEYLISKYARRSPFVFFRELAAYFRQKGYAGQSLSRKNLYEILHRYCTEILRDERAQEPIILDYCLRHRDDLSFMHDCGLKERAFTFLKKKELVEKYFPQHAQKKPTQLYKQLRFYQLREKVYAFDCENQIVCEITSDFA